MELRGVPLLADTVSLTGRMALLRWIDPDDGEELIVAHHRVNNPFRRRPVHVGLVGMLLELVEGEDGRREVHDVLLQLAVNLEPLFGINCRKSLLQSLVEIVI